MLHRAKKIIQDTMYEFERNMNIQSMIPNYLIQDLLKNRVKINYLREVIGFSKNGFQPSI